MNIEISPTEDGRTLVWRRRVARTAALLAAGLVVLAGLAVLGVKTGHLGVNIVNANSMTGYADKGSVAVGWKVAAEDLSVGDVVTVPIPDQPGLQVTHRIVEIDRHTDGSTSLRLQGDANEAPDVARYDEVDSAFRVVAVIPYVGTQIELVTGPGKWLAAACAAQTILIFVFWPRRREPKLPAQSPARRVGDRSQPDNDLAQPMAVPMA